MHTLSWGTMSFEFDARTLHQHGVRFVPRGQMESDEVDDQALPVTFAVQQSSTLTVETDGNVFERIAGGTLETCGAFLLDKPGQRVVIGNLTLVLRDDGSLGIDTTLTDDGEPYPTFDLPSSLTDFSARHGDLLLIAELAVNTDWADAAGLPELADVVIGRVVIEASKLAPFEPRLDPESCRPLDASKDATGATAGSSGPDVIVADLQSVVRYTRIGDITGYAVGTNACNVGTERVNWIARTNQHPVIIQNLYRLKDDSFEQIGMSWVKHGFFAVSQSVCTPCNDPTIGNQLGVGCSDPYSASLNGIQNNMSPRSIVNADTGYFPYPYDVGAARSNIERRLQVHDDDLNPALNEGAMYFIEGHYITPDDAENDTHNNNASYRRVRVFETSENMYHVSIYSAWTTQRQQAAVRAWQDYDPEVVETDIQVPGEGLFILGAKAVELEPGIWRYSYALQNLNSDRSAQSFSVPMPAGAVVTDIGFHDVDYHSGEPYDGTDWEAVISNEAITWSTQSYDVEPNANALRYDAIYSFYFDTHVAPTFSNVRIDLFTPGFPTYVTGRSIGPVMTIIDCNDNGHSDVCDTNCNAAGCEPPCGGSEDCNNNSTPDECEPDCDGDGVIDLCELAACPPGDLTCADCNGNFVPDGCEADCDLDGIPDACDPPGDTDGDGVDDCTDLCPDTTPIGACECPAIDTCCWPGGVCLYDYPRDGCLTAGGTPDCMEAPCRQGCLIGDRDGDGDLDHIDVCFLQACFSGPAEAPNYVPPPQECTIPFDFDDDGDVDLLDYLEFSKLVSGP